MNVQGTKSLLDLAKQMPKIEAIIHLSTSFAHCYKQTIGENLYTNEDSLNASEILELCNHVSANELDSLAMTKTIIGNHPNTYTFTKSKAEEVIVKDAGDLPVAIVRPSIVVASWKAPFPGILLKFILTIKLTEI